MGTITKRLISTRVLVLTAVVALPALYFFLLFEDPDASLLTESSSRYMACDWQPGDPVLFNLHMDSYSDEVLPPDPGHWFHFAEHNFPWFWLLREDEKALGSSRVFFNLDKPGKVEELNSFTRFLAVLSLTDGKSVKDAEFIHLPESEAFFTVRPTEPHWSYIEHEKAHRYKPFVLDRASLSPMEDMLFHLHSDSTSSELVLRKGKRVLNKGNAGFLDTAALFSESEGQGSDEVAPASIGNALANFGVMDETGGGSTSSDNPDAHGHHVHDGPGNECVKYMGTVGGQVPSVKRVCWLREAGDAERFRDRVADVCPPDSLAIKKELAMPPGMFRRITIYQRNLSRMLLYLKDKGGIIDTLREKLGPTWDVRVIVHDDRRSACELFSRLKGTDILLSPHGFQSMVAMLLPRGSMYFEIYPFRYYKPAYAPVLMNMGVATFHAMAQPTTWYHSLLLNRVSTEWCMGFKMCRGFARDTNIIFNDDALKKLMALVKTGDSHISDHPEVRADPTQWVHPGELPSDLGAFNEWEDIDCKGYYDINPHVPQSSQSHPPPEDATPLHEATAPQPETTSPQPETTSPQPKDTTPLQANEQLPQRRTSLRTSLE